MRANAQRQGEKKHVSMDRMSQARLLGWRGGEVEACPGAWRTHLEASTSEICLRKNEARPGVRRGLSDKHCSRKFHVARELI